VVTVNAATLVVSGPTSVTVATVAASATVPTPTVSADANVRQRVLDGDWTVDAPGMLLDGFLPPSATVSIPTPTIVLSTAIPTTVVRSVVVPAFTVAANANTLTHPLSLVATAISGTEIDLEWDDLVGASLYDIERNGTIVVTGHTVSSYSDTGLTPGTQYRYRVRGRP
jgi:hypothetical protein